MSPLSGAKQILEGDCSKELCPFVTCWPSLLLDQVHGWETAGTLAEQLLEPGESAHGAPAEASRLKAKSCEISRAGS